MKQYKTKRILSLPLSIILVALLAGPNLVMAAQPSVNLGTTASYAVLAGSAITNTGTTIINGDVGGDIGIFPGSAYTGSGTVQLSGTAHITDAAASQAKDDLMAAYLDASSRTPVSIIPTELGGTILKPGTYASSSGKFELTGTLTLDAEGDPEGVFVFIMASTLVTASDSNVVLQDKARFCRTFWTVGSSATLGTNSHFVGHIFAMSSITATTGATVQGQLLAINGAVTLDSNTITNGICEAVIPAVPVTIVAAITVPTTVTAAVIATVATTTVPTTTVPTTTVPTTTVPTTTVPTATVATTTVPTTTVAPPIEIIPITVVTKVSPTTVTITGGILPTTASPWYNLLFGGSLLIIIGAVSLSIKNR